MTTAQRPSTPSVQQSVQQSVERSVEQAVDQTIEQARAAIRALNEEYIEAARTADASWFRGHMAEDVVVVLGGGQRLGRDQFVAMVEAGGHRFRSLTVRNVTVRVYGAAAQVDADAPWEQEDGRRGVSRYIDTYAWLDGRWQVVSAQITLLPQDGRP